MKYLVLIGVGLCFLQIHVGYCGWRVTRLLNKYAESMFEIMKTYHESLEDNDRTIQRQESTRLEMVEILRQCEELKRQYEKELMALKGKSCDE